MDKAKVVSTPLAMHFKLNKNQCPSNDEEKEDMHRIPYASAMDSLMYAMVCARLDIAHEVGLVSHFLSNPRREHWNAMKWIMRYFREFIPAVEACKELLWMKRFTRELGFAQKRYVVYCDSQSAVHLSKNSTFHALPREKFEACCLIAGMAISPT
ncbi:hypothetical protein SLE2022_182550 [Rubroshorea leprosula]